MEDVMAELRQHIVNDLVELLNSNNLEITNRNTPVIGSTGKAQGVTGYKQRFLVKRGHKLFSITCNTIAYFFIENRSVYIRTKTGKKFLIENRLEELEVLLPPSQFFRINRSLIVSFDSVIELRNYQGGRFALSITPEYDSEVVVSRHRIFDFKRWLDL